MSEGFQHAIAGGQGILVVDQVQSPNFSIAGKTGWALLKNGAVYCYSLTAEGSITTNVVIVSGGGEGVFSYSGAPAAGNLVSSAGIESAGTDAYGNRYLAGNSSYGSGIASSVTAGGISFYSGSLSAGWTQLATVSYDAALSELFFAAGAAEFNAALVTMDGGLTVDGALTVSGTGLTVTNAAAVGSLTVGGSSDTGGPTNNNTSTNGLTSGVINGTSGAQSAGTAHTHGAGSYAVANGQHSHTLNSHAHPL